MDDLDSLLADLEGAAAPAPAPTRAAQPQRQQQPSVYLCRYPFSFLFPNPHHSLTKMFILILSRIEQSDLDELDSLMAEFSSGEL